MDKKVVNILKFILSAALAVLLVFLACRGIEWSEFASGLRSTRWGWIAMFIVASFSALFFRTVRWMQMLRVHDPSIRFGRVWDATTIGAMSSIAIPASGEFVRCGLVTSDKLHYETSLGIIVMERATDLVAILMLFLAALFTGWARFGTFFTEKIWAPVSSGSTAFWIILSLLLVLALVVFLAWKFKDRNAVMAKIYSVIAGFFEGFISFKDMPRKTPFIIFTFCIWISYMFMSFFVIKAIPALDGLGIGDAMFVSAIGNVASVVPVPGGLGAYHYLLKTTLVYIYEVGMETGLLFATLNHELHAFFVIFFGSISYVERIVIRKNRSAVQKK